MEAYAFRSSRLAPSNIFYLWTSAELIFSDGIAYFIAMKKKITSSGGEEKILEFNKKVRKSAKRPDLRAGDIIKIHRKIKEGNKERIQVFEGIVISIKGKQSSSPMATVRKVSFGVGVELTIPLSSPVVSKIEVVKRAKTRQSKLYYLRNKDFRLSKLRMKELGQFVAPKEEKTEEEIAPVSGEVDKKDKEEAIAEKEEKLKEDLKKDANA